MLQEEGGRVSDLLVFRYIMSETLSKVMLILINAGFVSPVMDKANSSVSDSVLWLKSYESHCSFVWPNLTLVTKFPIVGTISIVARLTVCTKLLASPCWHGLTTVLRTLWSLQASSVELNWSNFFNLMTLQTPVGQKYTFFLWQNVMWLKLVLKLSVQVTEPHTLYSYWQYIDWVVSCYVI